jgi:hypothetical protein
MCSRGGFGLGKSRIHDDDIDRLLTLHATLCQHRIEPGNAVLLFAALGS